MANFDIRNKLDRDIRRCKTRAFAAELYAGYPRAPGAQMMWLEIAEQWRQLAGTKERHADTIALLRRQTSDLTAQIGEIRPKV